MAWEPAEKVQKNDAGEYRAMIGGEWVPVAKAQKNEAGQFRVERAASKTEPASEPENPLGIGNLVGAAIEPNLTLMSGALTAPISGLAGVAGTLLPGPKGQGAEWARAVQGMTYQPQTTGGRNAMLAIGAPFELIAEGAHRAGGAVSDVAGPAAGAVVNTALQAAPMLLGSKYLPNLPQLPKTGPIRTAINIPKNLFGPIKARAGRLVNEVAGDKQAAVVNALRAHRDAIPGSVATAGEAAIPAGSAEMAALQEIIANRAPSKYGSAGIEGAQEGARQVAVGAIAKTPADLTAAETARSATANLNYGKAYANAIKADPELAVIAKNPYFKDALPDAIKLAEARGISPKANLTEFLHFVKVSLDKQLLKRGDTALGTTEKATVNSLKNDLVDWMGRRNPDYETARSTFAADSGPINRMKVGKAIEDALTNSLGTAERPMVFANLVKKAGEETSVGTGKPRISDLTPQEQGVVEAISSELARNAQYNKMAREGASEATRKIGATIPQAPGVGVFAPKINVARALYNRVAGGAEEGVLRYLAENADNPQKIADIMQNATPKERSAITNALMRYQYGAGAQQAARQGEQE